MKIKKILSIMITLVLLICISGCNEKSSADVPKPDISMKTVTQNSRDDYVTFEMSIPEEWDVGSTDYYSVFVYPSSQADNLRFDLSSTEVAYYLQIKNYKQWTAIDEDLFNGIINGNAEEYRIFRNKQLYQSEKRNLPEGASLFNYFDILTSDDNEDIDDENIKDYIKNFSCTYYNGKTGKIAAIQYQYEENESQYNVIECYIENSPYIVTGAFNENLELSSGDIALWVAASLKVSEHT